MEERKAGGAAGLVTKQPGRRLAGRIGGKNPEDVVDHNPPGGLDREISVGLLVRPRLAVSPSAPGRRSWLRILQEIGGPGVVVEITGFVPASQMRIRLRRFARPCRVSPARNSWTI